ncbi:MAG: hypothetical protein U0840_25605 [Gemmataceae bacterium]
MTIATIDLAALEAIATRAIPREQLQAEGYRSLAGSSDLFKAGYFVRHWYRISDQREVLEYLPRPERKTRATELPRLTATCYVEQVEIHRALGINLVGPGERWEDYGGRGLFDEVWVKEVDRC